ncbi:uncharacterized protein [Periplaneta americana]|uniref:uncharacterized protein n=1 Tax=Periplaneta americana TaxID=6978 RepID=UPI0037E95B3C
MKPETNKYTNINGTSEKHPSGMLPASEDSCVSYINDESVSIEGSQNSSSALISEEKVENKNSTKQTHKSELTEKIDETDEAATNSLEPESEKEEEVDDFQDSLVQMHGEEKIRFQEPTVVKLQKSPQPGRNLPSEFMT